MRQRHLSKVPFLSFFCVESFIFVFKIYKTKFVCASVTERESLFAQYMTTYSCRRVPCDLYRRQMPVKLLEKKIPFI